MRQRGDHVEGNAGNGKRVRMKAAKQQAQRNHAGTGGPEQWQADHMHAYQARKEIVLGIWLRDYMSVCM